MKACPKCNVLFSDEHEMCPACGWKRIQGAQEFVNGLVASLAHEKEFSRELSNKLCELELELNTSIRRKI